MLTIDLTGNEAVQAGFRALVPRLQQNALARLAAAVHDDVKERIGAHYKTGGLERSLRWDRREGEHQIYNDLQAAPHAVFVHWGTRAHVIRPRHKRALRWPIPGGFAFAQHVNHPGYKGDPYFAHAAAEAPRHFARIINQLQREL